MRWRLFAVVTDHLALRQTSSEPGASHGRANTAAGLRVKWPTDRWWLV